VHVVGELGDRGQRLPVLADRGAAARFVAERPEWSEDFRAVQIAITLARSVRANSSVDLVARWYEVQREEVRDAVEFEDSLAKAA
jgi:hypothetical protein